MRCAQLTEGACDMDLCIDTAEVVRYLGHRQQPIDERLRDQITEAAAAVRSVARPCYIYRFYDVHCGAEHCLLGNGALALPGADIGRLLAAASSCAVMTATIGSGVDTALAQLSRTSMAEAVIFDACATAAVESVCDRVEEEIADCARQQGRYITARFSPGYGDLPVEVQPQIVRLLDTHRQIGVSITESCMLVPSKSVTALIGLLDTPPGLGRDGCAGCSQYERCCYRRKGGTCVS